MESVFSPEHESVHFYSNNEVGLEAIIAIHSTYDGVGLGGCRIKHFNSKAEALEEALRLSRHMSYKALLFDLKIGGAKSVILMKDETKKTPQLLSAFARAVDGLRGQYVVSVDMGSDSSDMNYISTITPYVIGYDKNKGGAGDPGPLTARGIIAGMKAAALCRWSSPSLKDKKVMITGIGDVGLPLSLSLAEMGADLIVCDVDAEKVHTLRQHAPQVQVINPWEIYTQKCDIFSPCAGGNIFDKETARLFSCEVVAGASNNQLKEDEAGKILHERGILYVPDFAINAGGLIGVVLNGLRKISEEKTLEKIDEIGNVVQSILKESERKNKPTDQLALEIAQKKHKIHASKTKINRGLLEI